MDNDKIKKELLQLMNKAYKENEIPVAAIIIKNDKIIAKAYNKRRKTGNPLEHAEISCVLKATKKLKYWRLNGCKMYVSLEPCKMCRSIIEECGIEDVHYFVNSELLNKKNYTKYTKVEDDLEFKEMLKDFFKYIRKE